jgi:hypothetical protein
MLDHLVWHMHSDILRSFISSGYMHNSNVHYSILRNTLLFPRQSQRSHRYDHLEVLTRRTEPIFIRRSRRWSVIDDAKAWLDRSTLRDVLIFFFADVQACRLA